MQMQADLAQIPVEVFAHPDATAIGVGYLAGLGAGISKSVSDFNKAWQPAKIYTPQIGSDQAQDYLNRWRSVQSVSLNRE